MDIQTITTDQGNEYKGVYEDYLFETGIQQRMVLFDDSCHLSIVCVDTSDNEFKWTSRKLMKINQSMNTDRYFSMNMIWMSL